MNKSTVEQIRQRFDNDVERFSNLETGQSATMDAPLMLDLVTRTAAAVTPGAARLLDLGCGAGNYTLKMLQRTPNLDCTLIDLSRPMLDRAAERVSEATAGRVETIQGDVRELDLGENRFDLILAAMVLHHLRGEEEWEAVFAKLYDSLAPDGSLWIVDHVTHEIGAVQAEQHARWGDHLTALKDTAYRDHVYAYVEQEDTPRPLTYQLDLLRRVGFAQVDVLHKNGPFTAFGAVKAAGH